MEIARSYFRSSRMNTIIRQFFISLIICSMSSFSQAMTGCASWPLIQSEIEVAGGATPITVIDESKVEYRLIFIEKTGKNLWRQMYYIKHYFRDGYTVSVITENDISREECSMSPVIISIIKKEL